MNDIDLPPLEPDVLAVIDGASMMDPVPAATRVRLLGRVEAAIAGAGGGGGGGVGGNLSAAAAGSEVAAFGSRGSGATVRGFSVRAIAPLVVSFVLGAVTSAAVLIGSGIARPSFRSDASSVASRKPDLGTEVGLGGGTGPAMAEPVAAASAGALMLPIASEPAPRVAGGPSPAHVLPHTETVTSRSQLAIERRLLDKARTALEQGEPAVALSDTARHERQFPSGALAQEREAMAIRALVALGRTGEARARAARFRASYPDSVLLSTMVDLLDAAAPR